VMLVPLAALAVLFAVSNRESMSVGLWPFAEGLSAPAYLVALVPLAIGLVLGAGLAGLGTIRARWRHDVARRQLKAAERELDVLRERQRPPPVAPAAPAIAAPNPPPHP